ncbi:MAG: TetM/TetW/TetO/TetS family tetracycline resistance ribosomal protection protein [Lachnospiraceae bacterium]|nr:TetM/TetW/TetO/TetS family tetracycline resistance ribosomal protection protein [Lachnospiraceae bacterium]
MKHIAAGILAHVDAGKTTLSEALLYESGMIRKLGRVDSKNAFLDTDEQERSRGITIFSKQAIIRYGDNEITLLDTPGHVDFSAEMERTLWVMDYAILVISGADGVQGHTYTLWKLLKRYNIPVFVFVNKMDQEGTDKEAILSQLKKSFGEGFVDFSDLCVPVEKNISENDRIDNSGLNHNDYPEEFSEAVAVCDERLLETYLEGIQVTREDITRLISQRKLYPCFFGSALKLDGVKELLESFIAYTEDGLQPDGSNTFYEEAGQSKEGNALYKEAGQSQEGNTKCREDVSALDNNAFGAKVYKLARDAKGERLTYMKITSGVLRVKDELITNEADSISEKVNQIRIYSGEKYETVPEASRGQVIAVTGLSTTRPGQGIGNESMNKLPSLEPVLTYSLEYPEDVNRTDMLSKLKELEEEEPELHVSWVEKTSEIQVMLMGEVQTEVLRYQIAERYGIDVRFGEGSIVYKETIANVVEGVGHFEPLRHYAEVHLKMEPADRGNGCQFIADVSTDMLNRNWQNLILTHLEEKEHIGVLTGHPITDIRITVVGGRAHTKHTEGGDFRQATYRAVRQGLMQAENVLLEPYYDFRLEIPAVNVGRAMTDVEAMSGKADPPEILGEVAVLTGTVPVSTMRDYQVEVNSYTKGMGRLTCTVRGYDVCHNTDEVAESISYDPDQDIDNPSSSVFCSHGAGTIVPWYEVHENMHVEAMVFTGSEDHGNGNDNYADLKPAGSRGVIDYSIDEEQINEIINKTSHANERASKHIYKKTKPQIYTNYKGKERNNNGTRYLIVDGYNIVHAWDELKELVDDNLEGARNRLMDVLSNYQAFVKCELILVFDAYKVKGNVGEFFDYHNIHVVYTREAQTADSYIEQLTHEMAKQYQVTVATSDGLVQLITRGQNCMVISARELKAEIERANESIRSMIENGSFHDS